MYLVDCPNCGRSLRMKRVVNEAKLKCRYCQAVFVGSTRLSPEASSHGETLPVHAPQPDGATQYHRIPTRRRSAWPAGVVILGLAGAIVLGAWVYHNARRETPAPTEPESSPGVSTQPHDAPVKHVAAPSPAAEPVASSEARDADTNGEKTGPVEVIECARLAGPAEASATFVGTYENHSQQVMRRVRVVVTVTQADGKKLRASSIEYKNIPPGWKGPFSAEAAFRFEPGMRITGMEARVEPDPKRTGWALKRWIKDVTDDDTLRVSGEAGNTTNRTLADPVVWCDFFTKQGVYVGSAAGEFRRKTQTLAPGSSAAYDIRFDPKEAYSSSRLLADPQIRLLGTTNP